MARLELPTVGGAQELPMYKLAAHYWSVIDRQMRTVEGEEWSAGERPEFVLADGGAHNGHAYWRVGDRRLTVEGERVVETTMDDGQPTRRVIGAHDVSADEAAGMSDRD